MERCSFMETERLTPTITMKTITKSQVEELIEVLAEEEIECESCRGQASWLVECCDGSRNCPCRGLPMGPPSICEECRGTGVEKTNAITMETVFVRIWKNWSGKLNNGGFEKLFNLWGQCEFKPLQTLLECGWEEIPCEKGGVDNGYNDADFHKQFKKGEKLKSPQVNALCVFLYQLFIKK